MNHAGWAHSTALAVIAACLAGCGQTRQTTEGASTGGADSGASGGSTGGADGGATGGSTGGSIAGGGTLASTGGANVVTSGGRDPEPGSCEQASDADDLIAAPVTALPTRLEGTLCGERRALWITFEGETGDPLRNLVRAQLAEFDGRAYTVRLFGVTNGALQPLANQHETNVFELDELTRELVFGFQSSAMAENRVVLQLEGPEGRVALDLDRPELPPSSNCGGAYESLPVKTAPRALPVVLETEFCNFRDSRAWAIEVVAGRRVTITVENPWSIQAVDLAVYLNDVDYQPLPVTDGVAKGRVGLLAHPSLSFTPAQSIAAALYGSLGASRGEAVRLRVEQE
jgi:hypothetical protein